MQRTSFVHFKSTNVLPARRATCVLGTPATCLLERKPTAAKSFRIQSTGDCRVLQISDQTNPTSTQNLQSLWIPNDIVLPLGRPQNLPGKNKEQRLRHLPPFPPFPSWRSEGLIQRKPLDTVWPPAIRLAADEGGGLGDLLR